MYIDEDAAKQDIAEIAETMSDDFKITVVKKKVLSLKVVSFFFVLKTKATQNDDLFKSLMQKGIDEDNFTLIESEYIQESSTSKELFLIKCDINIFGV